MEWKDALKPGRWHLRDGRIFECTPADVRHFAGRAQEMADAGLHIPFCWEHQPDAVPLSNAEWRNLYTRMARHTFAHLKAARLGEGNTLYVGADIDDPRDLTQLQKTRYVSPHIDWDYQDPTGKVWPGPSILHVAATPIPIQTEQRPFRVGANEFGLETVSLSQSSRVPTHQSRKSIWLSGAGYEQPRNMKMADKQLEDNDETPILEAPMPEPIPVPIGNDDEAKVRKAVECLARLNLVLGEDTTIENLPDRLIVACETLEAANNDEDQPVDAAADETRATEPENAAATREESPSPVMMSQMASLKSDADIYRKRLAGERRERLINQINSMKCDVSLKRELLGELKTTSDAVLASPVSLSAAHSASCPILKLIDIAAKATKNAPFTTGTNLSGAGSPEVTEAAPHDGSGGERTSLDEQEGKANGQRLAQYYRGNGKK